MLGLKTADLATMQATKAGKVAVPVYPLEGSASVKGDTFDPTHDFRSNSQLPPRVNCLSACLYGPIRIRSFHSGSIDVG